MDLMNFLWPFFLPLVGAGIAIVHNRWKQYTGVKALETFLMWQIALGLGLGLMFGGLGHLLTPDKVAESIGWPAGSPFQREVGMWDFFMGFVGVLCLRFRNEGFWTATIIGCGLFLFSAGAGHVYEMIFHGNYAPNNAGGVMFMDLLYPVFLAVLLIYLHKKKNEISIGKS
ncbi:MAG: hypothetical protein OS112_07045 [Methanoregula sp.]|nr:MAG: hypothetical protein OS112_07045 [Methanoregula sp.]